MIRNIRVFLVVCVMLLPNLTIAQQEFEVRISRFEWPQPATADAVLKIPQLRLSVAHFETLQNPIFIIRYPGGDEGNNWANHLHNLLVSLGLKSSYISVEPGSGSIDTLQIIVAENRRL